MTSRVLTKNPLKPFIILENILFINRYFYNKKNKIALLLLILIEYLTILSYILMQPCRYKFKADVNTFYFFTNTSNSLILVSFAVYSSLKFKKLLSLFQFYSHKFPEDVIYIKKLQRKQIVLIFWCYTYVLTKVFICITIFYIILMNNPYLFPSKYMLVYFIACQSHLSFDDCRYITEFYIVSGSLNIIASQLDGITRSMEKASNVKRMSNVKCLCKNHKTETTCAGCKSHLRLFDKWSAAYVTATKCSKLIVDIFGWQVN